MLCIAKNNSEYVEVTPVAVVKDNSLLNVIKGLTSGNSTTQAKFELTPDMFDQTTTFIQEYRFYKNRALTKVEIPESITSIGSYAFSDCRSLTSITIGNGVTIIGTRAFEYCSSLTSITIPDSVTSIGEYAFSRCSSLISIIMSNGVKKIPSYTFLSCINLAIVDFRSATIVPTLSTVNAFQNTPNSCKFIIPDELYDSWIASTNWASLYASGYQFIKKSEYTEA